MEKKNSWAVIISSLSFVVALACVGFVYCKSKEMGGVVDLGTFVGICVGLIGVCATIIVGLQIWNHLEFRDRLTRLSQLEDEIKAYKDEMKAYKNTLHKTISNVYDGLVLIPNIADGPATLNELNRLEHCLSGIDAKKIKIPQRTTVLASLISISDLLMKHIKTEDDNSICLIKEYFKDLNIPAVFKEYDNVTQYYYKIMLNANNALKDKTNAKTKDAQPK